jgi:hypothetical protein
MSKQRAVSMSPKIPRLIRLTRKSKSQVEKVLVKVNPIEMKRTKGVKKKLVRMHQCFTSYFMYFDL